MTKNSELFKWIPNCLSLIRMLIAIAFPFLHPSSRSLILALALLTEYLDGALARKFNWVSLTGQVLDPIADKLLVLSVGLTFIAINKFSLAELLLIGIRDITAGVGFIIIVLLFKNYKMIQSFRPNLAGKMTTFFQYLVFFDILVATTPHTSLIVATSVLSLVSAIQYTLNIYFARKQINL